MPRCSASGIRDAELRCFAAGIRDAELRGTVVRAATWLTDAQDDVTEQVRTSAELLPENGQNSQSVEQLLKLLTQSTENL